MEVNISFFVSIVISVFLVIITTTLFYEVMRLVWRYLLPEMKNRPYLLINLLMLAIFAVHTVAVWTYGLTYWLLSVYFPEFGILVGENSGGFMDAVYFSASTYSSLAFGDIFPKKEMRMIAGVEVLNGLILIGWSVYFTYLAMEKIWNLHPPRNKKDV